MSKIVPTFLKMIFFQVYWIGEQFLLLTLFDNFLILDWYSTIDVMLHSN